jgi:hypothetical protein
VAKRLLAFLFLLGMLFIGGCGGPSPSEIGEMELIISFGIIVLSWPIVVLLTLLTKQLNLSKSGKFWIQYFVCFVVGVSLIILNFRAVEEVIRFQILSILGIPYLLFATNLLLLILPKNFLVYLPSFLLIPHFVMSGLLYATDSKALLELQPILFVLELWYLTMPMAVIIFITLLVQRKHGFGRNAPHTDK